MNIDDMGAHFGAMMEKTEQPTERDLKQRRSKAVRTAWVLAAIALAIFAAFVLSGIFGEAPVA